MALITSFLFALWWWIFLSVNRFMVCFSVQKAAIPPLLEGKDVFVKSKTGTGAS